MDNGISYLNIYLHIFQTQKDILFGKMVIKMTEIILDTDIGSDCDDMMALSWLIYAQKSGKVKINAISVSHKTDFAYGALSALFDAFDTELPSVGQIRNGLEEFKDNYCQKVAEKFPGGRYTPEDSVRILRRALVQTNDKAILCGIGPMTNIASLLKSVPDGISPLDGRRLLLEKCSKIVLMAGNFTEDKNGVREPEWNVKCDISAAKLIMEECDNEIVILPYELGIDMITGEKLTKELGDTHPLTYAFICFNGEARGRHSWDPATVLYAVQGCGDYFQESEPGVIRIGEQGESFFTPQRNGKHKVLSLKLLNGESETAAKKRISEYMDKCVEDMIDKKIGGTVIV